MRNIQEVTFVWSNLASSIVAVSDTTGKPVLVAGSRISKLFELSADFQNSKAAFRDLLTDTLVEVKQCSTDSEGGKLLLAYCHVGG